jgi:hypothetical protein
VIAEGYAFSTLTNGRSQVIHGMKTSGGCHLVSTLNNIDGVVNENGAAAPTAFFQNAAGDSAAVQAPQPGDSPYDEQARLSAPRAEGVEPNRGAALKNQTLTYLDGGDCRRPPTPPYKGLTPVPPASSA